MYLSFMCQVLFQKISEQYCKLCPGINRFGPRSDRCREKLKFPKHYDNDLVHPDERKAGLYLLQKIIERCFAGYSLG